MKNVILNRLPQEVYSQVFEDIPDLQNFYNRMAIKYAGHIASKARRTVLDGRSEDNLLKNRQKLKLLQEELPALQSYRDALPANHPKLEEQEHALYEMRREIKHTEEAIDKENAYDYVNDVFEFTSHEQSIEAIEALADQIGAWFSTGALGQGSVTFNGKTYTAE